MLKQIVILALLILGNYVRASDAVWTTKGLDNVEVQVVDEANASDMRLLSNCMVESEETEISETSCIQDVFGDVHN